MYTFLEEKPWRYVPVNKSRSGDPQFLLLNCSQQDKMRLSANIHSIHIYIYVWIYENGARELHPTPLFHLDFTKPLGILQAGQKIEKGRQWKEDKRVQERKRGLTFLLIFLLLTLEMKEKTTASTLILVL